MISSSAAAVRSPGWAERRCRCAGASGSIEAAHVWPVRGSIAGGAG